MGCNHEIINRDPDLIAIFHSSPPASLSTTTDLPTFWLGSSDICSLESELLLDMQTHALSLERVAGLCWKALKLIMARGRKRRVHVVYLERLEEKHNSVACLFKMDDDSDRSTRACAHICSRSFSHFMYFISSALACPWRHGLLVQMHLCRAREGVRRRRCMCVCE